MREALVMAERKKKTSKLKEVRGWSQTERGNARIIKI